MTQDPPSSVDPWQNFKAPVEEDMRFQRRFWRVQRIGWAFMALVLIAAALGVFSEGPLSWTHAQGDQVTVEYQRVYRNGAPSELVLSFSPGFDGERTVILPHSLLQKVTLETITPTPERSETQADGLHLTFAVPDAGPESRIYLQVRPNGLGPLRGDIRSAEGGAARLRSFILP